MSRIINGKEIAEKFCDQIKLRAEEIQKQGTEPHIALINVGDDPASDVYVSKKKKLAASLGISSTIYKLDRNTGEIELEKLIRSLNDDSKVHAILLQSPLPDHLNFRKFIDMVNPEKDVDGLTTINLGKLFSCNSEVSPCTPLGVLHLLNTVHPDISGLHAAIIGRSFIVGRPLAQLLLNENCTVTTLHSRSKNLPEICRTADILISAVGRPLFVGKEFVKPGTTVIDVGVNRIEKDGAKKIVGDVNFDEVKEIAAAITPVPNGVGPMTVAYLMHNALILTRRLCHL
ncbi:MAG: bifunctional methylenetetrahydrofolate dehydrogenase/methenyltetrahydrofolate cyclohydrolase [Holosporaceae bacterium]|jgi:methylenetetrahydrofolate dehydrogenase (NADP+)/methenyltetrahydrofolate cyclohydrolase|nr:bifunctional methylenetetrahydrofolate dehydrogenase/methenyltetrahydrofolate cyclohydrolase [Holosporaceae bacterium]